MHAEISYISHESRKLLGTLDNTSLQLQGQVMIYNIIPFYLPQSQTETPTATLHSSLLNRSEII